LLLTREPPNGIEEVVRLQQIGCGWKEDRGIISAQMMLLAMIALRGQASRGRRPTSVLEH
jgi:hypothetical protein